MPRLADMAPWRAVPDERKKYASERVSMTPMRRPRLREQADQMRIAQYDGIYFPMLRCINWHMSLHDAESNDDKKPAQ